jgi:catechol 2,3-dioxygenase-like lactoylglutathione lyase family enzyme
VFDHVTIRASDRDASERFYATVLATLNVKPGLSDEWVAQFDGFSVAPARDDKPVTRRLHVGFAAPSRAHVDEFWRAGTQAGYRDDGAPGPRPEYGPDYYGGFLLDPDGNSAEAAIHDSLRSGGGCVDHLWIRVADLAASKRFYETIAGPAGLRPGTDTSERVQFRGSGGSFSLLPGEPTEDLHMAFAAPDDATVDAFHRTATAAGYRDNGPPGERAIYHPGYYGAFVLDPDDNNIEVVNHNRE